MKYLRFARFQMQKEEEEEVKEEEEEEEEKEEEKEKEEEEVHVIRIRIYKRSINSPVFSCVLATMCGSGCVCDYVWVSQSVGPSVGPAGRSRAHRSLHPTLSLASSAI